MAGAHLDLLWLEDPENIYYLTGCCVSRGMVFLFRDEVYLALDSRYFEQMKKIAPIPLILDHQDEAYDVIMKAKIKKVGIEFTFTDLRRFQVMKEILPVEYSDTDIVIRARALKDQEEIKSIQESSNLLWEGYQHIKALVTPEVTENFLSWEYEKYIREKGAEGVAFEPTVAFGKNAAFPHYKGGRCPWKNEEVILMDLGVKKNHYCSDMTRMLLFPNTHPKIGAIYQIIKKAYEAAINVCKQGIPTKDIDRAARSVIEQEGFGEFFQHGLGHGVGINVHEYPRLSPVAPQEMTLEYGMVFTIEPGIYLPGIGGVRYENTLVLTGDGVHSFFPHDRS